MCIYEKANIPMPLAHTHTHKTAQKYTLFFQSLTHEMRLFCAKEYYKKQPFLLIIYLNIKHKVKESFTSLFPKNKSPKKLHAFLQNLKPHMYRKIC